MIKQGVVPNDLQTELLERFDNPFFPWYWADNSGKKNFEQYPALFHTVVRDGKVNSDAYGLILKLLRQIDTQEELNIKGIVRMQVSLLPQMRITEEDYANSIYQDLLEDGISITYFLDDSDGQTEIFEGDQVVTIEPTKGKYIVFDATTKQRTVPPATHKRKMTISIICEKDNGKD